MSPALPRYRFVALAVVWCACLVVFLSRLCGGPLSPFPKQAFDLSNAQIGGLTSATAIAYAPTLLLAGWLVDRSGIFARPPVFGFIVDRTGSCAPAWRAMVGASAGAAVLLAFVREPRRA